MNASDGGAYGPRATYPAQRSLVSRRQWFLVLTGVVVAAGVALAVLGFVGPDRGAGKPREVLVEAGTAPRVGVRATVHTSARPVTGEVFGCGPTVPPYLTSRDDDR